MSNIWTIAKHTLKSAVRYRLVLALALAMLVVVFGIPVMVKDDGTAKGLVQLVLTYTLGATTALLGLSSLWLGCGLLAREIEDNVMQMVAVKPVARWQIWLGKWVGITMLNTALVATSGALIFFMLTHRAGNLPDNERQKIESEILVARSAVRVPVPEISRQVAEVLGQDDRFQKLRNDPTAEARQNAALLVQQAGEQLKQFYQMIPPGLERRWEFDLSAVKDQIANEPLFLRFKFNAGDEYDPKSHLCQWRVGEGSKQRWPEDGSYKVSTLGSSAYHEMKLPPGLIPDDGKLHVNFLNQNEKPIIFLLQDGPEILYREDGFAMNLARGLGIILCWLGVITAMGLMASSFLAFPVAAFLSFGLLVVSFSTDTLEQEIEEGGIAGVDHETGKINEEDRMMLDRLAVGFFRGLLVVVNQVWDYSPVDKLSSGRTISWAELSQAFATVVLLIGGLFSALGIFAFHHKELALPNPTASLN